MGNDPAKPEFIRLSGEFHRLLANIAGNHTLGEMLEVLIARSSLIIALYENHNGIQCSHNEHESLAQTLLAGETAKAVASMEEHLLNIERRLNLTPPENGEIDLFQVFGRHNR